MLPEVFTMTPIEGGIWQAAVGLQTAISSILFNNFLFKSLVFTVLGLRVYLLLKSYEGSLFEDAWIKTRNQAIVLLFSIAAGFMFLYTGNGQAFKVVDAHGKAWKQSSEINADSNDGLYWYTLFHKASNQISVFMTTVVSRLFSDEAYEKSPDLLFKSMVATADIGLDNNEITAILDSLASQCSDTINGRNMDISDSLGAMFDLGKPECDQMYSLLKEKLHIWAESKTPGYIEAAKGAGAPEFLQKYLTNDSIIENKLVASAIVDHVRSRKGKDGVNTNYEALQLNSQEHFWTNLQRVLTGEKIAWVSSWFGVDAEATITKNEAAIVYNRYLNLLPSFRGALKAFLVISFVFAAAILCLGDGGLMKWWFKSLGFEMLYSPASALCYQFFGLFIHFRDKLSSLGAMENSPLMLVAAAEFDNELARIQTVYFLLQTVIAFSFCFGILHGAWAALKNISFTHDAGMSSKIQASVSKVAAVVSGGKKLF